MTDLPSVVGRSEVLHFDGVVTCPNRRVVRGSAFHLSRLSHLDSYTPPPPPSCLGLPLLRFFSLTILLSVLSVRTRYRRCLFGARRDRRSRSGPVARWLADSVGLAVGANLAARASVAAGGSRGACSYFGFLLTVRSCVPASTDRAWTNEISRISTVGGPDVL